MTNVWSEEIDHRRVRGGPFGLVRAATLETPARPVIVIEPGGSIVVVIPTVNQTQRLRWSTELLAIEHEFAQGLLATLVNFAQSYADVVDVAIEVGKQPTI